MKKVALLLVCMMPAMASAQTVIREEITHVNGVKLARPIVTYDAGMPQASRPPLLRYEERILIRGQPVGIAVQTQRPFVEITKPEVTTSGCPGGVCPVPQQGFRFFRR